ncbi:MAG TPA: efflux RND transporter periplasmic adaptor subunit [Gemmatimonadaceae bacterium]|nr:efflux RND transporter periplasmic adaptor subunit [Gemmatimonadaceae bacterium]
MRYTALLLLAATALACNKDKKASGSGDSTKTASADAAATPEAGSQTSLTLPVAADEARDGDLVLSIVTTGLVRSESETKLKSEVGGTIEAILARPGDHVTKGQPIIRLAPYEFDLAVRKAEAAVSEAQVRYESDYVPDSLATGKGPTPERLKAALARSGLTTARLNLETAKYDKERSTIRAPFDGVIDHLDVSQGERIGAGQIVTILVDQTNLRIEAAVLEHDIALVRAGGDAQVSSAAAPNRVAHGKITAVLPIVDSTSRAGRAYVRVQGNDVLKPGMYADVRLEAQRLPNRRLVPAPAIIQRDGRDLVFVVKNGRAQWTYVVPGRSNGSWTEILPDTSGQNVGSIPVKAGDVVIVQGQLTLTHDAPVRVVAKAEADTRKQ